MNDQLDISAKLTQLAKLHAEGALTDQEFQSAKASLLADSGQAAPTVTHGEPPPLSTATNSSSWKPLAGWVGGALAAVGLVVFFGISRSEEADCNSSAVHHVLFDLLRQNFPVVLQKSDNLYLAGLGQVGGFVAALAAINPDKRKPTTDADRSAIELFRNPGDEAQLKFNFLTEQNVDPGEHAHVCHGSVHLSLNVPDEFRETFKSTEANVDVVFQVANDISQPGRFVVRLRNIGN